MSGSQSQPTIDDLLQSMQHDCESPTKRIISAGVSNNYFGPPPPKVQRQQQLAIEKHEAEERKKAQQEFDQLLVSRPFCPHDTWWLHGCGDDMEQFEINEFGSFLTQTIPTPQVAAAFKRRFDSLKCGGRLGKPTDAFVAWLHPEYVARHCVTRNGVLYAV
jgi:hypothetical protein